MLHWEGDSCGRIVLRYKKELSNVPLHKVYHPELDEFKLLNEDGIIIYQYYMGILWWCVKLIRIDITYKASKITNHQ